MLKENHLGDIPVFSLKNGTAQADICAQMGANCIRLRLGKADVLRTPPSLDTFKSNPNVYGEPLLFPPNRIAGGRYEFAGREYTFPINEPARGHHIHGLLSQTPFALLEAENALACSRAVFFFEATKEQPYLDFPHTFSVTRTFELKNDALTQRVDIQNTGDVPMPTGIGFHTSLNVQFLQGVSSENLRLTIPVQRQILVDKASIIPTGERTVTPLCTKLNEDGVCPQGDALSAHFERGEGAEIALRDLTSGAAIHYWLSPLLRYIMLWNAGGNQGFVCPEPQSWMVDAPNQSQEESVSGFRALAPGDTLSVWTRLSVEHC